MITASDVARRETDVPDLIPARMLNEFAYCPRLAYLEWVQGEFADNLETREGRFGHRRVDRESTRPVPEPEGADGSDAESDCAGATETIHSRSLMLSAPVEGLIAKMDLVDINASTVIPVDYKRGRVPNVPGGVWEPEQVQVCAQGLILRENGYHCEGGIIYFIESRRRVSVPLDEDLVERTRQFILQMREMAASGTMPPPLVDSPKCPRCSLVGICLPDETSLVCGQETATSNGEVRRLMPARDDALPLYVQDQGVTLGKTGDQLAVKRRQEVVQKVKLLDVSQVCLFGNVQVTAQALREITARDIPVCHFSYGGWFHGMTRGMAHKNIELRLAQFALACNDEASTALARRFIVGKIKNCRVLLRRHLSEDPDGCVRQLADLAGRAEKARQPDSLLGIEGTAAKIYFSGYSRLLNGDHVFSFENRNRRPPRDPVNALLSFVYAMLTKELTVTLFACGFDPMLGFFHRPRYGRPSLALDLVEEFRPLIADSVVLRLINNGEVSDRHFISRAGAVALTPVGRRAVIAGFERRMDMLVRHPIFKYRVSYRRVLEVQARLLARTVLGEIEQYPSFSTR